MPRLRRLSARQILRILHGFGFSVASIRGSSAKLKREPEGRSPQVLTVPLHRDLAPGTIQAIFRQALRFIREEELRPHFFGEDQAAALLYLLTGSTMWEGCALDRKTRWVAVR
jgi:predicted RNA binding protein YcfA (HicA-like mRNA interferase family)